MKVISFVMAVFAMTLALNAAPAPGYSDFFDVSINLLGCVWISN
jgi:hypothetical protein